MNRTVLAVVAVLLATVVGAAAWWFSQGTEAPSVDVTAPSVETTAAASGDVGDSSTTTTAPEEAAGGLGTYALTDASRAVFTVDEELRGTPTTVVATSTIVLGEVAVDPGDPVSTMQIGTILINARDFTTDSGSRNRAIRGPILDADSFEFIEFAPTSIDGVADTGNEVSFTVVGDLTIRDTTNPVSFDVTATRNGDGTISGTASATIDRTDWGLDIPNAPGVANVSEDVALSLEFVAAPTA
ncbi:MAG: YceI family protein [Acidimicrobiia bacterium]